MDFVARPAGAQRREAGECGQCHVVSVRRKLNLESFRH